MKYSKKDAKALTILLFQWPGENKDHYIMYWQKLYGIDKFYYPFPICLYTTCDKCPIRKCSDYMKLLIAYELSLKERKNRAALMARKVRSLKW